MLAQILYKICSTQANLKSILSGLVAAAFASLNSPESDDRQPSPKSVKQTRTQQIDSQISKASDVNSLLVVAEMPVVSRRHALKVSRLAVVILADDGT